MVLASRVWGINGSARTLVYADDILLSALIGNNNTNAVPRWGMIAPEEIARVDFLYGPFSAAYPGNSMGGVLVYTTKMPDKFEKTLSQTESIQNFSYYNTKDTYRADQTSATIGNRWGDFSAFVSFNYLNSYTQPLGFAIQPATAALTAGTTGWIPQLTRTGTPGNVLGATGLLHTEQMNLKGKFALDITNWLRATYTVGLWTNDQSSNVQTYLRDAAGNPTFGGQSAGGAFASGRYELSEAHLVNAFSLKSDTKGNHDFDLSVMRYNYLEDIQRSPFAVTPTGTGFTNTGRIARMDGTGWTVADAKGIWRPTGVNGEHEVSYGYHYDNYILNNPTYQTANWTSGASAGGQLYTSGLGQTQTQGVWAQDAWRFAPMWKSTLGLRWESWSAFDGFNLSTTTTATGASAGAITGTTAVAQPGLSATKFSPKAALTFEPSKQWEFSGSFGVANRFPTVTELYQNSITSAGITVVPNPNLKPEQSLATEVSATRKFIDGKVRLSLFEEHTKDLLIAQTTSLPGIATPQSVTVNVDKVRNRGAELAWQKDNVLIRRLELFGSVTYVDSRILSDPTFVSTIGTTAVGKRVPYVPMWRTTLGLTYRPIDQLAWTFAGRYQSKVYGTLDNTDIIPHVYQAFDPNLVYDTRLQDKVNQNGEINVCVDNILNEKYHLFHPFPQRTYVVQGRLKF